MPEKVIWKINTSRHDWSDGAPLRRLLEKTQALGLTGPVSWVEAGGSGVKKQVELPAGPALANELLKRAERDGEGVMISAGGHTPALWNILWNCYPYDAADGFVSGFNTLWLEFDRSRATEPHQSGELLRAFMELHGPEDTEYAVIHPATHWGTFDDLHYERPVTISLMFRGAFWANFLGRGHLDEFDLGKLRPLATHQVKWVGSKGLFFITAPDLAAADKPETEAELLRVTELFRRALRPDSRWS
jgi:hypothetical protein